MSTNKIETKLSNASKRLLGQPMFKILAEVKDLERQGHDIVHFEIGDPDFETPAHIKQAAIDSINNDQTHYVPSGGTYRFKEAISDATEKSRGFRPKHEQVLVCPGANAIIQYALEALVNPGEEVILPNPGFPTYYSVLSYCDVKPVEVPLYEEDNFIMRASEIEKRITDKTRLIIVNSPQNPTGGIIPPEEYEKIVELAKKHDLFILSDEMYSRIVYDEDYKFSSPSTYDECKERTIIINGFSKVFAMTGWRLGVAIGPEEVIEKMRLILETTVSCVSAFIQDAGIAAINGDQKPVKKMISTYNERRDLLCDGLNKIKGISCIKPRGALYLFANIKELGMTSDECASYLLQKAKVAVLPGTNFGSQGEGFVRLSFCIATERMQEGLNRIEKLLGSKA